MVKTETSPYPDQEFWNKFDDSSKDGVSRSKFFNEAKQKPNIPSFQHSIVPIVSEANLILFEELE